ncbi:2-oxoglutarate dehydrogenase complex dihydrolipoyllysine-residue succinyltransferase [Litoribrevibacter albus]|uniref:Dihydrolipoyllysine-residue succinyltransferase component of 2-oxoglutarate dehydrogenase complex n=1 Tax=Litoribrevibacter albus TaxID=1473156 RepID=A0AA37W6F0_9GAMM|nr:2-oxoglutarate dehydrogenase complex dihydrolipoyllysine-residue succinyltransferase [Litoribrevibacter albus]GLQ31902.1 dihydrolipoyllysine-residue succinyltransferase component of 2-oxoglutarate dehydrogenase complex [Litoribrevibacter albus]
MAIEIKAPTFPESVAEGNIATWHKQPGEAVSRDELIVDIETDKVVLEVAAPADGVIAEVKKGEGDIVLSDEVIAIFEEGATGGTTAEPTQSEEAPQPVEGAVASPAARKLMEENGIEVGQIAGSGKNGLVTKEDVVNYVKQSDLSGSSAIAEAPVAAQTEAPVAPVQAPPAAISVPLNQEGRLEKRVPMTRLRASIAKRLLSAQHDAAMLTTFNEVNMKPIMDLRAKYKDQFEQTHSTKLGFMSFFVKAAVESLKKFPEVNASIDGNDIVYHGYYDVGVAVSSDRGLVVPVLRDSDGMTLADIEGTIKDYGVKAREGKLAIEDMQGGTFTITNGGVFGSLMSTPILNPPQTAILGMHKIQERPMAVDGEVVILPMMYLALSYDHRLIDGKEAVQFLVSIKELLEEPAKILLNL